jgi:hypothetical protein
MKSTEQRDRKPGSGGKRSNSGRTPKYSEKTGTIAFRVPISHIPQIQELVAKYLSKVKLKAKKSGKRTNSALLDREHIDS